MSKRTASEMDDKVASEPTCSNELITCGKCAKALDKASFSNKQFKRYLRDKTAKPHCLSCTKEPVAAPAEAEKEEDKKKEANEPPKDPSVLYLQNPFAAPIVNDFKRFFKRHYGFEDHEVSMDKKTRWRTAVKLAVRGEWADEAQTAVETHIGLFQPGTHKVVDCTQSVAHHTRINKAVSVVQESLRKLKITGYIEGLGADEELCAKYRSYVRYLLLSVERSSGKVQLSIVWNASRANKDGNQHLDELVGDLLSSTQISNYVGPVEKSSNLFHAIYVNHYPASKHCNAITGREPDDWILRFGQPHIVEKVATDLTRPPGLCFPPFVFRQANLDGFTFIIQEIRKWVKEFAHMPFPVTAEDGAVTVAESSSPSVQPIYCLELYGGVGTIGLNAMDYIKRLSCCDENPNNEKCFYAALENMSKDVQERACYATYGAATICTNLNVFNFDLVIVDPPRKGLDDDTLQALIYPNFHKRKDKKKKMVLFDERFPVHDTADESPEGTPIKHDLRRLIYVSCGFEAFKRDCDMLTGVTSPTITESTESSLNITVAPPKKKLRYNPELVVAPKEIVEEVTPVESTEPERIYWKLVFVKGFILFPGSNHIETLAVFDRIYE